MKQENIDMDEFEFVKYVNMIIEGCGCKAINIDLDTRDIAHQTKRLNVLKR